MPQPPRPLRLLIVILLVVLAAVVVIRHLPFYLPRLGPEVAQPAPGAHLVFGYATLASPLVRYVVVGRAVPSEPGRLAGLRREGRDARPAPGARIEGRVFVVSAPELRRLDRYERLGTLYERVPVVLEDGRGAWVYRLLPARAAEEAIP
ncbi:gamma-glutamylcyclotransferase family protein [Plastorhodobacter daqingensis]|uniref:Gamma-glutamylcyclotransferase family protein n=1 Tax=Plastorhodobacter daqingensis TaxID=1387281 RepID=A0ABW2UHN4_9RHOB